MNATKRPWIQVNPNPPYKGGRWIFTPQGHDIAETYGDNDEEKEANAALIVRAVNAHDTFVKALTEISLCSRSSMSSKDECGRIARAALQILDPT